MVVKTNLQNRLIFPIRYEKWQALPSSLFPFFPHPYPFFSYVPLFPLFLLLSFYLHPYCFPLLPFISLYPFLLPSPPILVSFPSLHFFFYLLPILLFSIYFREMKKLWSRHLAINNHSRSALDSLLKEFNIALIYF